VNISQRQVAEKTKFEPEGIIAAEKRPPAEARGPFLSIIILPLRSAAGL
jgi:hypothetical protein